MINKTPTSELPNDAGDASPFSGKRLLITGGTGSFGNTVLKRFLSTDIKEIVVFSRDEKKQEDMRLALSNPKVKFQIGCVRDLDAVRSAMEGVDYVFHAAALKQVPSCEFYPLEAVKTNVLGTENVLKAAEERQVSKIVLLSTDKAVYPINAMGISKAMAEKVLIGRARQTSHSGPVFCATRYGNVMASRGSVIPLFVEKIKAEQPLPITDPSMTRFLMSLEDSLDLVMHAMLNGAQGDIFVQKAPAASIETLASALRELFDSTVPLKIIGSRHGEKLYETLVSREEIAKAEQSDRYFRIPADNRGLNYDLYLSDGDTLANSSEDYTSHNTTQLDVDRTKAVLLQLKFIQDELRSR